MSLTIISQTIKISSSSLILIFSIYYDYYFCNNCNNFDKIEVNSNPDIEQVEEEEGRVLLVIRV